MKTEPVIKEVLLNVPVSKVWKAITNKQDMSHWCFDLLTEFKPEKGFEFQFKGKGEKGQLYLHLCKVTEAIPGKKLSYSWRYKDYLGNSLVTFELFEEGEKTRLRLTHEGIESFGKDNPDLAKESFDKGWSEILGKSLKEYLEEVNK
jgi:uncharacterized protein YndB with AHSA1/START domain